MKTVSLLDGGTARRGYRIFNLAGIGTEDGQPVAYVDVHDAGDTGLDRFRGTVTIPREPNEPDMTEARFVALAEAQFLAVEAFYTDAMVEPNDQKAGWL